MKTLKPFVITLLVVLVAILTSCSKSNNEPPVQLSETDMMFAKYIGNYSNITCRTYFTSADDKEHNFYLLGIKNKHLWFSLFDSNGTLKQTWEDIEETDSVLKMDRGYGEYETFHIESICPYSYTNKTIAPFFYTKTDTGNIIFFHLSENPYYSSQDLIYTVFTSNNKSKHVISIYDDTYIYEWYNNSVLMSPNATTFYCYSQSGDMLYTTERYVSHYYVPVSYEEGIGAYNDSYWPMKIFRNNLKTGNNVWTTECKAPFDIPTDANPKYTSTLLDKSTDVWKYKVNMVYYDGTKKEFTFTININTGEYKASV